MLPRTADILVVSPQAGNCFDAAEMIPPVRSSVRLVIMSINPLYAPPTVLPAKRGRPNGTTLCAAVRGRSSGNFCGEVYRSFFAFELV